MTFNRFTVIRPDFPDGIKPIVDQIGRGVIAPDFETERAAALALKGEAK